MLNLSIMSVKRYSSSCVKFTANVKINGKQTQIVFDRYNSEQKRRFIDISDLFIQKQLDNDPGLNTYFKCDFVIEDLENMPDDPCTLR